MTFLLMLTRPLTCNIQKRESSVTTTTILTEIPTPYANNRGSNGALQMTSNARAVSPLMVSAYDPDTNNFINKLSHYRKDSMKTQCRRRAKHKVNENPF